MEERIENIKRIYDFLDKSNYQDLFIAICIYECIGSIKDLNSKTLKKYDMAYERYMDADYLSGFISEEVKDIFGFYK